MDDNFIYNLLVVKYMEKFHIKDELFIFPSEEFSADINTKIEMLAEAINNDVLVTQTKKYQEYREGFFEQVDNQDVI